MKAVFSYVFLEWLCGQCSLQNISTAHGGRGFSQSIFGCKWLKPNDLKHKILGLTGLKDLEAHRSELTEETQEDTVVQRRTLGMRTSGTSIMNSSFESCHFLASFCSFVLSIWQRRLPSLAPGLHRPILSKPCTNRAS